MDLLIVKEDVGIEGFEDLALFDPAQEEGFVDADVPGTQGTNHPFVGRGGSCSHESRPDGRGFFIGEPGLDHGNQL